MKIVYIVQDSPGKNLIPAKEFGSFVFLLKPREVFISPENIVDILFKRMKNIENGDYVLLIGDPLAIGLAMLVASELVDMFYVLRWNKHKYEYRKEEVNVRRIIGSA